VKGSGLGLAIAREYAVAHGGRIEVLERADGRAGARFRLWLPLAAGGTGAVVDTATADAPITTMGSR
jgi:signal transduction histidine kinase